MFNSLILRFYRFFNFTVRNKFGPVFYRPIRFGLKFNDQRTRLAQYIPVFPQESTEVIITKFIIVAAKPNPAFSKTVLFLINPEIEVEELFFIVS
jgi:hypothetical protein